MDEEREFTSSEKAAYQPPPCPKCGHKQIQHWEDSTGMGTGPRWMLGNTECTSDTCTRNGG